MDVDRLRAETRKEHEAVESLVPLMSAELTREQYMASLRQMYSVVHGWELWAVTHAPPEYRDMLAERQRSPLIQQDLQSFGEAPANAVSQGLQEQLTTHFLSGKADQTASEADFLGAMYVMEGSTLGGQYIARFVEEKFGLSPGEGDAYFRGYGERTGSMWQSFKAQLTALPEQQSEQVIAAAKFMFGAFGAALLAGK